MKHTSLKNGANVLSVLCTICFASGLFPAKLPAQEAPTVTLSSPPTYTNPLGIAIGDPDVLHIPGQYYIYGTGGATFTSTNLVNWSALPNTAPSTPDAWWSNSFWAPEVYADDGKYYMFYSAQWKDNPTNELENYRIGVAVANNPAGPFINVQNRPIFDPGYPIIDADVLFDTDGRIYLYYSRCCYKHSVKSQRADWAKAKGWYNNIEESWVYGVQLKQDFSGIIGHPVLLLRPPVKLSDPQSAWEDLTVTTHTVDRRWTEGPSSLKHGNTYYIMYAANSVAAGGDYATGYATSNRPLGHFKKGANNPIIYRNTASGGNVTTTGHTCWTLSPDGKEMFILYGAVVLPKNSDGTPNEVNAGILGTPATTMPNMAPPRPRFHQRVLFLDRLEILPDGTLVAHSPTVTPQPYPSGATASSD
jgi:GH43 family beta-xylosidase